MCAPASSMGWRRLPRSKSNAARSAELRGGGQRAQEGGVRRVREADGRDREALARPPQHAFAPRSTPCSIVTAGEPSRAAPPALSLRPLDAAAERPFAADWQLVLYG